MDKNLKKIIRDAQFENDPNAGIFQASQDTNDILSTLVDNLKSKSEEEAKTFKEISDKLSQRKTKIEVNGTTLAEIKGEKGDKGDKGEDGKTPVYGTDYLVPEEKLRIFTAIKDEVSQEVRSAAIGTTKEEVSNFLKKEAESIKGDKGDQGEKGETGKDGKTGDKGDTGKPGKDGIVLDVKKAVQEIIKDPKFQIEKKNIKNFDMSDQRWHGSGSGGTGNVIGPSSSTDKAISRFNGTTGKIIQDSLVTISDAGNLTAPLLTGQYTNIAGSAYINPDGSAVFGGGTAIITNLGEISGSNLSGTNTGDQNLFSSIAVSGQTTVTADSPVTALTLVAGSNVTLTTDNTAKSVTIAASGGGGGTPGGSNTQIQYNNSSAFGGMKIDYTDDTSIRQFKIEDAVASTDNGEAFSIIGANGGIASGSGGSLNLTAGSAQGGNSSGGGIVLTSGNGVGNQNSGDLIMHGAPADDTGRGGRIIATAGTGGSASGNGGSVSFTAGSADSGGTVGNGGDVIFTAGVKNGAGSDGSIFFGTYGSGRTQINVDEGNYAILDATSISSSDKIFTFPNQSGTLALIPASPASYTVSNVSTDRSYDAIATSINELANVLGTLIADLRAIGLIN